MKSLVQKCHGNHKCKNAGSGDNVMRVFTTAMLNRTINGEKAE